MSPMNEQAFEIILASGSPRRRMLLEQAGVSFSVRTADVDESLEPDDLAQPEEACKKLAERKARAVVEQVLSDPEYIGNFAVIGSDTMVVHQGEIFGKPVDESDAHRMLSALSGETHQVMTSVSLWLVQAPADQDISLGFRTFVDTSAVTFKELAPQDIKEYLAQGESFDKAGAYAIQGAGARLIDHYEGSMDTIIGLPVERLLREFPELFA